MKRLYEKYFYVPKHGKVSENVLFSRITLSFIIIVLCLGALTFTAYAYFSFEFSTPNTTITAGYYDIAVASEQGVTPDTNGHYYIANATGADVTYSFTLSRSAESTTMSGFCAVRVNETQSYYTDTIGYVNEATPDAARTVKVTLKPGAQAKICFIKQWSASTPVGTLIGDEPITVAPAVSGTVLTDKDSIQQNNTVDNTVQSVTSSAQSTSSEAGVVPPASNGQAASSQQAVSSEQAVSSTPETSDITQSDAETSSAITEIIE